MLLFRVYRKAKRMTKRMVAPRTAATIVVVGMLFSGSGCEVLSALAAALLVMEVPVPLLLGISVLIVVGGSGGGGGVGVTLSSSLLFGET